LRAFQPYQEHGMGRHGLGDLNLTKKHKRKTIPSLILWLNITLVGSLRSNYFILKVPFWQLNYSQIFQKMLHFPSQILKKKKSLRKINFEKFQPV
jgi:hypothetical protein